MTKSIKNPYIRLAFKYLAMRLDRLLSIRFVHYVTWLLLMGISVSFLPERVQGQTLAARTLEPENLRFEYLSTQQGLSKNHVWCMHQDREGFMWFGTDDGLNKYDGYSFTVFKPDPNDPDHSLQHYLISDIHEDRAGRLWVATNGGGLHLVDKRTGKITPYGIEPIRVDLWNVFFSIHEDREGILWIGSSRGLVRFDPNTKQFRQYPPPTQSGVDMVTEDSSGRLWVCGAAGVYHVDRKTAQFTQVLLDSTRKEQPVGWSLHVDQRGILWAGTSRAGIFRLDTRQLHRGFVPYNPGGLINPFIHKNYGFYEDAQGYVWVLTAVGLQRIQPKTNQVVTIRSNPTVPGGLNNNVRCMHQDRNGTLWVGTTNGINKAIAHPKPFFAHQITPALPSVYLNVNTISTLLEDRFGVIWVGSAYKNNLANPEGEANYGLHRFDARRNQVHPVDSNLADGLNLAGHEVWALHEDRTGHLWVGTATGLHWLDRTRNTFVHYPTSNPVYFIDEANDGRLWLGLVKSNQSAIAAFDPRNKQFSFYYYHPTNRQDRKAKSGLNSSNLRAILCSRSGYVYVATGGGGINRLNPRTGQFTYYMPNAPFTPGHLNDKDVRTLYEDADGIIWAGTGQGGLNRLDPKTGRFSFFSTHDGLPSNFIMSTIGDDKGNIWLGTDQGLSCFNPRSKTVRNYQQSDGLPSNDFRLRAVHRRNGKLLFGTVNGFVVFHPDSIRGNTTVPPVYITGVKVREKSRPVPLTTISLPHNDNFLSFEFVALNYEVPEKNQYAYQLEGVDKAWVYSGSRRYASYTDVTPGEYVFRVKGSNNDGVWNQKGTSILLVIHPPWWRSWWAYTLYGLLLVTSIWLFIAYRSHALQRENRVLEEKVALRTEQLEHKSTELEHSLENLKATQTQLIQKEKMASLGELTAGIAHEIQNPLNFVNNFSEVSTELVTELEEEQQKPTRDTDLEAELLGDLKQNLQKITHHGGRASRIVKGMLEHSRTATGEKQLTNLNGLADEYLRLAYQGIRAKDKSFNAELNTDFTPDLDKLEVVPQELGRVLLNLYNNAFYAVQQKQKTAPADYKPTVRVSTQQSGSGIEIRVQDNGTGIPDEVKSKIFQPFFTTKPTGEGTGLGLSLSFDIVTKGHEGSLTVESGEGEGTTFLIQLPTGKDM